MLVDKALADRSFDLPAALPPVGAAKYFEIV